SAGRADRMAERDRAAVDVDLVPVEAELATIGESLGGESLIDLDQVEGLQGQLDPVEEPLDALDRGEEQPLRGDLGLGIADDPGERPESEALNGALADDYRRGRSVGDPWGVAGGHGPGRRVAAVLAGRQVEDRLQPCQRLRAGVPSRPLVDVDDRLAALGVANG